MVIERKAGFARLTGPRGPVFSHMYYKKYFYGFLQKKILFYGIIERKNFAIFRI